VNKNSAVVAKKTMVIADRDNRVPEPLPEVHGSDTWVAVIVMLTTQNLILITEPGLETGAQVL
jgi:hypothetical protein